MNLRQRQILELEVDFGFHCLPRLEQQLCRRLAPARRCEIQRQVHLARTAAAPTAAPTAAPPAPPERLHIAEAPESGLKYPVAANRTLTGKVSHEAVIGEDGAVREVNILSGNRALAGAAARAVKLWRYRPYELNGHAVEAETRITFSFLGDDVVSVSFSR